MIVSVCETLKKIIITSENKKIIKSFTEFIFFMKFYQQFVEYQKHAPLIRLVMVRHPLKYGY